MATASNHLPPPCSDPRKHLLFLIGACTGKLHLRQIHAVLLRTSLIRNSDVFHHFLSRVALSLLPRDVGYSRRVFSQRNNPSASHWNTMIRAYSVSEVPQEGFRLFQVMRRRSLPSNPLSSTFVLRCCVRSSDLTGALQIHGKILRDGFVSDSLLLTTLTDLYSVCGRSGEAHQVFDEIPHKDTVSWNVLISSYLRNKRSRDVLGLFESMQNGVHGCETPPDRVTCLLVLQACSNLNALELGERVHTYIDDNGFNDDVKLSNSLISMYSRCGSAEKAHSVFSVVHERNVISWSAMISGLAMNGFGREAIEVFDEMLKAGIPPDEQTFTGVLSACSHSGLVEEGMAFFEQMSSEFGILPNLHHYGCVVDLLGRVRLLDKAYDLVSSMEMKPDPTIWRTLLGACKVHGYVELGERVISHLIELKAEEAGDYVLLLNMYSSVGQWEKVTELRRFMKENGIQTTPGCSTVELQGTVHEFVVDDVSHPRKVEIYRMLREINQQLRIAGYVAEVRSELHNLGSEEEKGEALSYHSEKLAIAFGILETPPGTTIRIAKNLRTCVDCHAFAKFVSDVYGRALIVRDRSRFHHFRGGRCSCNDYW